MAKLTEFGVAVAAGDAADREADPPPDVAWMAPEALRGDEEPTDKADVYSFGMLLCALASKQARFVSAVCRRFSFRQNFCRKCSLVDVQRDAFCRREAFTSRNSSEQNAAAFGTASAGCGPRELPADASRCCGACV
jgi:Protein tyrosine and serine/threonine kinase